MNNNPKNKRSRSNSVRSRLVVLNEEELIRQISMRPILYDRTLKAYRKSGLRMQFWKEVASEMNATVEECRRRWRSLRDAFSKHFKHANRCESEGTQAKRKKWVFYDQMSFMASYLDSANCCIDELLDDFADNSEDADGMLLHTEDCDITTQQETNAEQQTESNKTATDCNNKDSVALDDEQEKYVESLLREDDANNVPQCFLPLLPDNKSPMVSTDMVTTTAEVLQPSSSTSLAEQRSHNNTCCSVAHTTTTSCASTALCTENDSDERFLLSCAPALRRLTNRKNALARLKIQQILFDIEFGAADN